MKASVLINNHNYGRFLSEAIRSVLEQTYSDIEIIVVDDGSTDESISIIETYPVDSKIIFVTKKNGGQLSAFNSGFAHSSGEIIFFMDADDVFLPDYIERVIKYANLNLDVDFFYSDVRKFGLEDGLLFNYSFKDYGLSVCRTLLTDQWIGSITSAMAIKREMAMRIFPVQNEPFWRYGGDYVVTCLVSLLGGKKISLPDLGVMYRVHGNNNWAGKEPPNPVHETLKKTAVLSLAWNICRYEDEYINRMILPEVHSIPFFDHTDFLTYVGMVCKNTHITCKEGFSDVQNNQAIYKTFFLTKKSD
jgi:glycosyltransferase involved in cell wall biosynthesis